MSGAVSASSLAMMAAATAGTMVLAKSMAPDIQQPQITAPEAPPAKAQTKAPDRTAMASANKGGAGLATGNAGTLLTGPSGIDPSTLNLGKNVLLGQ